jgi:TetR/AcrR family transcriptional repressor of nem operon
MWRRELGSKFEQVFEKYPPRRPADARSLADEFTVVIEGAFVMGKAMGEPELVAAQLSHFRNYVELLFRKEEAGG